MSTELTPAEQATKRFNAIVITLISTATVISAITAFLQNDASGRSNTIIRNGQKAAIQQMDAALQSQQRQNYDSYVYQQWSGLSWEHSLALRQTDSLTATQDAERLAELMQLTADFSPLTSPPYLTDPLNGSPDLAQYYAEQEYDPTYYRELRIALTQEGNDWSSRAASYVTILTLLAVALFLFGLATTIAGRVRGRFVALGVLIVAVATGWLIVNVLTPIKSRPDSAMRSLAMGHVDVYRAETLRGWGYIEDALPYFQSGIEQLNKSLEIDPGYPAALQERAAAYLQAGEQRVWDKGDSTQFLQYAIDDYLAAIQAGDTSLNSLWNLGWTYYLFGDQPKSLEWTNRAIETAPEQIGLYLNRALSLVAMGKKDEASAAVQEAFDKAAALKVSSANFYFRATIHDVTKLLRAFPNRDLEEMLTDVKQKYVSLRYRKAAPVKPTGMQITSSTFYGRIDQDNVLQDPAETFEAGTEKVYFGFNYNGLVSGSEVEALIYYNDREDDSLTVLEKLNLAADGLGYIRIESPFINSGGLASGKYRVDLHIEGELLATGEFEVQ